MPNATYLTVEEAAHKYGVKKKVLTQLIADGMVQTRETSNGELLVVAENNGNSQVSQTKEEIIAGRFAHLRGKSITVTTAADKYGLNRRTILRWKENGYINETESGSYPIQLDEADVAYCAFIYNQRQEKGRVIGSRLFDDDGNPYVLKYPDLAESRRKQ